MSPKSIKRLSDGQLQIVWDDGHDSRFPLGQLRDQCPCAGCQGETVLLHTYVPPPVDRATPGRYELKDLSLVGSYAMQCSWGDGHATGIYTWERLRASCPCGACATLFGGMNSTIEREKV